MLLLCTDYLQKTLIFKFLCRRLSEIKYCNPYLSLQAPTNHLWKSLHNGHFPNGRSLLAVLHEALLQDRHAEGTDNALKHLTFPLMQRMPNLGLICVSSIHSWHPKKHNSHACGCAIHRHMQRLFFSHVLKACNNHLKKKDP